jgi:hypothetical protein
MHDSAHWWQHHLVDIDHISLEADGHTMPREITDVVEVDMVFTTCAMNELDVSWVEMQLEELPEGIIDLGQDARVSHVTWVPLVILSD